MKKIITSSLSSAPRCANAEQDDLLITPYLNRDALPSVLARMMALAPSTNQQDMLLISTLTALSSTMPNCVFRFGKTYKAYHPNLQAFIMAAAASGKGICGLARELVSDIHNERALVIPGDASFAGFFTMLAQQEGRALLFETEGSVITDTWRSQARSYNAALRQAAEHETISRVRAGSGISAEIDNPQISCLFTGTYDQYRALIPSVQNGYFSRQLTYVDRSTASYMSDVFLSAATVDTPEVDSTLAECRGAVNQIYRILSGYKSDRLFCLTAEQAKTLGSYFATNYAPLISALGPNFHASVARLGVTTMRILMILSILRLQEQGLLKSNEPFYASQQDFETALRIAGKLLLHAADAFTQINGDTTESVPAPRCSVQRLSFFAQLPEEFAKAECLHLAEKMGVAERTMERWLGDWTSKGDLSRIVPGLYRKSA